jgi:thiosulfate/3-mercaptopyruvate sulfurtransferase
LRQLVMIDSVVEQLGRPTQTVIDARGAPRYRGEVEPLDPIAGHIPGALNRPFTDNFTHEGFFKSADVLKAEWDSVLAGRSPSTVVHHCGSGVSAVPNLIAMELAGFGPTALYAGSWSEWSRTAGLPWAKG